MQKYLILIILILLSQQTQQTCDPQCRTCNSHSPYDCTSCSLDPNANLYIKSCQPIEPNNLFFYIAIVLIIVHLIMIILGYGVYRNVFENLQMLALIGWGYGSQSGANQLVILNFTVPKNNSFISTFGVQFFLSIAVIGIFIVLVSAVDRLPHNSVATLIKRKKLIFPLRIESLIFNITVFTGLAEACTINPQTASTDIGGIIVGAIALVKQAALLGIIFYHTNLSNFQIDDHNYYVLIEKMSTCRWYARNNFFLSLLMRGLTLVFFVALFDKPAVAGALMLAMMLGFTGVSVLGTKFVKRRFWVFNLIGNLLTCACIFCIYGCGGSPIGSDIWQTYKKAYFIFILTLCTFFLLINLMEIIANSHQMAKQLRSIYSRFIICEKMDDAVQLNKYDSDKRREKVISFRKNLIYQGNFDERNHQNRSNEREHGEVRKINDSV